MSKESELVIVIIRVKDKYLKCSDIKLKEYIGKIIAGDIKLKEDKS